MEEQIQAQIHLALAICAHDGFISDTEVGTARLLLCAGYRGELDDDEF